MSKLLTWGELRDLPFWGTHLVFPHGWDIYPHCIVPDGTRAFVVANGLSTGNATIAMITDNAQVREALREWNGCVEFNPMNDGHEWTDESPVALATEETNA